MRSVWCLPGQLNRNIYIYVEFYQQIQERNISQFPGTIFCLTNYIFKGLSDSTLWFDLASKQQKMYVLLVLTVFLIPNKAEFYLFSTSNMNEFGWSNLWTVPKTMIFLRKIFIIIFSMVINTETNLCKFNINGFLCNASWLRRSAWPL